jgi:putative tryptophan/tyrosine transport system substrate-binding protein
LQISLIELPLDEVTPTAIQRAFAEIAQQQSKAIIVNSNSLLAAYRQLIVELAEKSRLPALCPWCDYVEGGGLMAYASDNRELWRRMADDVHQILNGAKPADIPIFQPTKFEFVINLKAAQAIGLTLPPSLLARADEVIEWGGAISRSVCCPRLHPERHGRRRSQRSSTGARSSSPQALSPSFAKPVATR